MNANTEISLAAQKRPGVSGPGANVAPERTILIVYLCYRLGITALLWALFFTESSIGTDYPALFASAALSYLSVNILLLGLVLRGWEPRQGSLLGIVLSDIFLLQLIALSSGPIESGLGTLMVIAVAAGAIFLHKRVALIPPALATLTLFTGVGLRILDGSASNNEIVGSGWLGMGFFIASISLNYLAQRMQESEAIARQEASSARKLEQLNKIIIGRMQTGVLVVDEHGTVIGSNRAALKILPEGAPQHIFGIEDIDKRLAEFHAKVLAHFNSGQSGESRHARFSTSLSRNGSEYKLTWLKLTSEGPVESLIFIEDLSRIKQQAQQLKLSSLGKLTASIAHEIRNPVGAASHAAQLLKEGCETDEERQLAEIVVDQCKRCSNIISNIMEVSRGDPARDVLIDLADWLPRFAGNYQRETNTYIRISQDEGPIIARFDPVHIEQLVRNLLDNAVAYSGPTDGPTTIAIVLWLDDDCAIMDVMDTGRGVEDDDAGRLFEPFFTKGRTGSGLGLYICRELCTANQATISYVPETTGLRHKELRSLFSSHCFRVRFSHPDRQSLSLENKTG